MPAAAASDAPLARRGLDPRAVDRWLHRVGAGGEPPWLHREIARRLLEHLEPLATTPRQVVEWWPTVGGLGPLLAARWPGAEQVRVAPAALAGQARAAEAGNWWQRLTGRAPSLLDDAVDAGTLHAAAPEADLVVAGMVLQSVFDVPALFARWHALLAPGGVAAFATLGPGSLPELRAVHAAEGWPPPSPLFIDMHDLGDMLVEAGYTTPVLDQETLTLTFADPAAALAELRGLGGNTHPARHPGLRTRRFRERLEQGLGRQRDRHGRVTLTLEVAYGHGFKGVPRTRAEPGAAVPVSLDALRRSRRGP